MARIKGIDIPNEKRIEISLTYIYGVGRQLAKTILKDAKVDVNKKAKDLTEDEIARIRKEVEKLLGNHENVIIKILDNDIHTPSSPRNYGMQFAAAPYVGFLDGDDSFTPSCLQTTAEKMKKYDK